MDKEKMDELENYLMTLLQKLNVDIHSREMTISGLRNNIKFYEQDLQILYGEKGKLLQVIKDKGFEYEEE